MPQTKSGNKHIIILTDTFSKYAICKAVKKSDAKNVTNFLFYDLICIYENPKRILSGRNQSFLGKVIRELNKLFGIEQRMSSGFKPSTQSITERFNSPFFTKNFTKIKLN
jgi:hypothetical protein